jgi:WhiB family transcriptional regulator, redox-sensing transcriptional regulator
MSLPCQADPDRWIEATNEDIDLKEICRACPRRGMCAKEAAEQAGIEGMWAGVVIPLSVVNCREHKYAMSSLTSIAHAYGYEVDPTQRRRRGNMVASRSRDYPKVA